MRVAIFGDSHNNAASLAAILQETAGAVDAHFHTGDVVSTPYVGYRFLDFFRPGRIEASIAVLQRNGTARSSGRRVHVVRGNHEQQHLSHDEMFGLSLLSPHALTYFRSLENELAPAELPGVRIHHPPPTRPLTFLYNLSDAGVHREFDALQATHPETDVLFHGHTHFSCFYRRSRADPRDFTFIRMLEIDHPYPVQGSSRYIINPGPTNMRKFPKGPNFPWLTIKPPTYLVYDTAEKTVTFRRVPAP